MTKKAINKRKQQWLQPIAFFFFFSLLIIAAFISNLQAVEAQNIISFTTSDEFIIPKQNAMIKFGFNGSYSSAVLENSTWIFSNLTLEHPETFAGIDLNDSKSIGDLRFSAENSNVTIWAYLMFYYTLPVHSLVYSVEGSGRQTINLGLNSSESSDRSEWSVIVLDNVFLAEGQEWTLLPGDTVVINGQTGNVTVAHFELGSFERGLFFYVEHSVAILTGLVLAAIIVIGATIKLRAGKTRKKTI